MENEQKYPRRPDVFNGGNRDALKRLVEAVEREDCRLLGQVQDAGRGRRELSRNDATIGASPLPDDLSWTVPHALSGDEIRQLAEEFAMHCGLLREAGRV